MGEVYRAQDTQLGRTVALKFLSAEFASHQSRLKRFIQEAKAASALNHPNILTVHEIGRQDDYTFIATEFVEGLTLREYMRQRLRLNEILDIAIQIASALVAAHATGIVHRDIKPDNMMVRKDGIVKVLDFGLAKLTEKQTSSFAGAEETTMALLHTEPGAVLGTAAYMSPEQAEGREVDARSDIWSLGVVLYEMIAARTPFEGSSKSHIIVAIMDSEPPPVTQLAPEVPQPLEWIIGEALTKNPDERCQTAKDMLAKLKRLKRGIDMGTVTASVSDYPLSGDAQSAADATVALSPQQIARTETADARSTAPSEKRTTEVAVPESPGKRTRKAFLLVVVPGILTAAAIVFGLYKFLPQSKQLGPTQMRALTTSGKINAEDINGQLTISPDGKYVVFAANDAKQQPSLWIRQVSTSSLVRLVQPENGGYLGTTFSPDGEWVYYVATLERNNFVPTLYRVPVLGGTSTKVLDHVSSPVTFSQDGKQFAFVRKTQEDSTLMLANMDGTGEPRTVAMQKEPNGFSTSGPSWSIDGKRVACGMFNGPEGYSAVVEVPVDGGDPKSIGSEKWANVGRVVWLADGSGLIMAAQPEASSIGTQIWFLPYPSGPARRLTNDLNGYGEVSLGLTSDSRTIATIQQVNTSGIWIGASGADESQARQIVKTNLPDAVAWTPNGKIVYASRTGENWDIWIVNRDGSETKQLTSDAFIDQQPAVSGDGRYIVFQSNRSGARKLWRMDIDGSNLKQLTAGAVIDSYPTSSPDGRWVIFMSQRGVKVNTWKVSVDGGSPVEITDRSSQIPIISPDGKSLAYFHTDEQTNNQPKLSIMPFEGGEPLKTIDLPRTVQPLAFAWLPDGRAIAYLNNASGILNVWSQPIDGGAPKQLTNFKSEFVTSFAIARDGTIAAYRWSATRDIVLIKDFR
jgi:eukaryotic-like serine/threonine-protein kinase